MLLQVLDAHRLLPTTPHTFVNAWAEREQLSISLIPSNTLVPPRLLVAISQIDDTIQMTLFLIHSSCFPQTFVNGCGDSARWLGTISYIYSSYLSPSLFLSLSRTLIFGGSFEMLVGASVCMSKLYLRMSRMHTLAYVSMRQHTSAGSIQALSSNSCTSECHTVCVCPYGSCTCLPH